MVRRAVKIGGRRHSKYNARSTVVDGIRFASKREATAWASLKMMERVGNIRALDRQVKIPLHADNWALVGHYIADFTWEEPDGAGKWVKVIADAKGFRNALYLWKKSHVLAEYGIEIREL